MSINIQLIFGGYAAALSMAVVLYGTWLVYIGQVKPHIFTVFTWFIISSIIAITMFSIHENATAWRNCIIAIVLIVNLILCYRQDLSYINKFDLYMFLLALMTVPIWLFVDHKELSLVWLSCIEILGILPTIRKAWVLPYELNPIIYFATSLSIFCQFMSLNNHTLLISTYFLLFSFLFFCIGVLLISRRQHCVRAHS